MSLSLRESFTVSVPPERVWQFLIDPARVVRCLPGAELTETVDAHTYRGRVKVKVGPISTAYDGTAQLTEVDDGARKMRIVGEGREMGAAGSAKMTMVGNVSAHPDGSSLVEVDATIDIAGRVMQFGRGLVESVSRQLFRQFADAVRATLEKEEADASAAGAAEVPAQPPLPNFSAPTASNPAKPPAAPPPSELRI
ncbi:MAG: SRPBCC family protein, partial [Gemmatimonadaceae bacterium]